MDLTRLDHPEKRVLRALFELARRDQSARPDVLARALDLDLSAVSKALTSLASHGLVDLERVRLTLAGLAFAVRVPPLAADVLATSRGQDKEAEVVYLAPVWLQSQGAR